MNHNLAEYHVPMNADVHDIDVIFMEETDAIVNPLGVKGLGETGVVGVAAAIANAGFPRDRQARPQTADHAGQGTVRRSVSRLSVVHLIAEKLWDP
jgi:hypothetical protein